MKSRHAKRTTTARHNISYTKRYVNKGKRQKAGYEHKFNEETNLLANPTGLPRLRQRLV